MKLSELSLASGVSERNIKRYIHERLLPPAIGRTRGARYDESHRRALLRIESLRAAGLTLEEVRTEVLGEERSSAVQSSDAVRTDVGRLTSVEYRYELVPGLYLVVSNPVPEGYTAREIALRCQEVCESLGAFSGS